MNCSCAFCQRENKVENKGMPTREEIIFELRARIAAIIEQGTEDTVAWEYEADLKDAIKRIQQGEDPKVVLENL